MRERPKPDDYGLPPEFSVENYLKHLAAFAAEKRSLLNWLTFAGFIGFQVIFGYVLAATDFDPRMVLLTIFTPLAVIVVLLVRAILRPMVHNMVVRRMAQEKAWEVAFVGRADAFLNALKKWKQTQAEAGFAYWRDLKGIPFEQAVAEFFRQRGGTATLTTASGDGGVDIILELGATTYWCQCKGYRKPVAVAAIRQIAGAALKSGGLARAVIFSTNGYTKPALDEARQLGVICLDGLQLSQLAYQDSIECL